MWDYNKSVFYQIYPISFCGAPYVNDGVTVKRIDKIGDWAEHLQKLGVDAIYLSPIFESDSHGYDTRDFFKIDNRLGSNQDFKAVVEKLHSYGIKVVIDAVFNHVGRGFWAFQDVLKYRHESWYKEWFNINFDGNNGYNDGLWYKGWEGHYELVKLNLKNPSVIEHLLNAVKMWIEEFGVDGLRLDVAYMLDRDFMKTLRSFVLGLKQDFFLVGESIHGDYNQIVNDQMLMSATNYECYKGLYSAFNSYNMFEIAHSLMRQFGKEQWTLYKGKHLLNFVDNHDVTRVASILTNKKHLPLIYALLFAMPGIPCIYYGSEWGEEGEKQKGSDENLRPYFEKPKFNQLTNWIAQLCKLKKEQNVLSYGDFESVGLTNKQFALSRSFNGERIIFAINIDENAFDLKVNNVNGQFKNLLTGEDEELGGNVHLEGYQAKFLKLK